MSESAKGVLLIVDDEPLKRVTLQIELSEAGYTALEAPDAVSALKQLNACQVDVVVTDLRMPEIDGMQFLEEIKARSPRTQVILMTAFGSVDSAVEAIKRGAYDYLTKPFRTELLLEKLDRLFACRAVDDGTGRGRLETLGPLVGWGHASRCLFEQIRTIADNQRTILIRGESGTGKKCVAGTIHQLSRRSERPLITFSCAGPDPGTLDRELFGSNLAASADNAGRFELARGGTLLLEHVDALPLASQATLLGVVQQGALKRADSPQPVPVDVRLLCATEKDLRPLVAGEKFREDLYHHLAAVLLVIPPLRDRREDIPALADHFLGNLAARGEARDVPTRINLDAMDALVSYHWPGNVRELEQVIERAAARATADEIQRGDVVLPAAGESAGPGADGPWQAAAGLTETIAGVERTLIDAALRRAAGNQAKAAQFLGIPRTTLRDKMTKYGMVGRSVRDELGD